MEVIQYRHYFDLGRLMVHVGQLKQPYTKFTDLILDKRQHGILTAPCSCPVSIMVELSNAKPPNVQTNFPLISGGINLGILNFVGTNDAELHVFENLLGADPLRPSSHCRVLLQ